MNEFYDFEQVASQRKSLVTSVIRRMYVKMLWAMLVTAATALYVSSSSTMLQLIYGNSMVTIGLLISQVVVVLILSGKLDRLNVFTANLLFFLYSILTGVVLSSVLLVYTATSVTSTFFITAGVFAAMSIYGYFTTNDLSNFGSIIVMAFIGLIVLTVVNIFLGSSGLGWLISFLGVAVFIGLTAWDTQKIKHAALLAPDGETAEKLATIGALSLYLDFVNLFLYLLRFFGGRD
ncbi:MAG: Bax inhibitor-1 family protein [Muribaculaceae bacterium]